MSQDFAYVAAEAPATERAVFIRRTYGHLAGAILAFAAIEAFLLSLPNIGEILQPLFMSGKVGWLIVLAAFIGVGWLANIWAQSDTSPAIQYLGLSLYVIAEAAIFLPLLYIVYSPQYLNNPGAIQTAGILTLAVFGGLTAGVFITRKDFSFLGPVLAVGSFLALGLIVAGLLIGFSLGSFFAFAMVALISGYILFYTSNVLYHYRTDQHVAAALALFACVATLFWYILQIVGSSRD